MASFNSITIDLSPITEQIDQLKTELKLTQERLERAENRIRDLQRELETKTTADYASGLPDPVVSKKPGGLGKGLETLMGRKNLNS